MPAFRLGVGIQIRRIHKFGVALDGDVKRENCKGIMS